MKCLGNMEGVAKEQLGNLDGLGSRRLGDETLMVQ